MNKERLLRLADRLEKVKEDHFDINSWYNPNPGHGGITWAARDKMAQLSTMQKIDANHTVLLDEGFCGSTACVLGHAALIKDFNKEGLYVDVGESRASVVYKIADDVFHGVTAGTLFFDIPYSHAEVMFYYNEGRGLTSTFYGVEYASDATPWDVAKAIRLYVETDDESLERLF